MKLFKKLLRLYRIADKLDSRINGLSNKLNHIEKQLIALDNKNDFLFYCSQNEQGESLEETKTRVLLNIPKADGDLRVIQKGSAYILKRLKEICDENGITFFLEGGTLIGAERHHGFIPWDDDIDIGMLREDYWKLWDVLKDSEELSIHYYYMYNPYKTPVSSDLITKVKLKNSDIFYVDVFPYDCVDVKDLELFFEKHNDFSKEIHKVFREYFDRHNYEQKNYYIPQTEPSFDADITRIIKEKLSEYGYKNCGDTVVLGLEQSFGFINRCGIYRYVDYFPLLKDGVTFENGKYCSPKEYKLMLNNKYGDYMSLPSDIRPCHTKELEGLSDSDRQFVKKL